MKFIEDLNLKLVYEKEIADVISRNNVDSKKFYELKTFKDQVGNKNHTEWHFNETIYTLELFNENHDLIKRFQTSYKDKVGKQKKEFENILKKENLKLVEYNKDVHIGDIYVVGEVCTDNTIEHHCMDFSKLEKLKIAYIINDPDKGVSFHFKPFTECAADILMYKHLTTVLG